MFRCSLRTNLLAENKKIEDQFSKIYTFGVVHYTFNMTSNFLHFCSLHPFLILPGSIIAMLLIYHFGRKRYPKASNLVLLLPVFGVINLIYGGDWNKEYVYNHGVKGTGVIVRIENTNNYVNRVQVVNYHCLIKTNENKTVKAYFENSGDAFYPANELELAPQIGESFSIKYIPGDEDNFIILTNDIKSNFSNKINCTQLLEELVSAQAAYNFDKTDAGNKRAFKRSVEKFLQTPCDTNLQNVYRIQLEALKTDR